MGKKTSQNNNKMEFAVRVATHSILKELNNGGHEKNLVLSPLCLHIGLNLLTAGATGQTLDQLLRFLDSKDVAQLNAQSSLFMELVTAKSDPSDETPSDGSGPIISLVNGIWVDRRFPLKPSFKQLADEVYKANSESFNFQKAKKVARKINAWAKECSKGHIENLVSSKSLQEAVLILASALYFKGSWAQSFHASDTVDEEFHLLNRKRVRVQFMKKLNTYKFYRSFDGFKQLKMEYKTGQDDRKYAMHIFLPNQYDGLQELIQKFHSDTRFFTQNHELHKVKIDALWLPKLKYEYGVDDLAENMKELGLDLPFRKNAELTEIVYSGDNVYVTKTIHKSYIEVNEEGTIATSVNVFRRIREGYAQPLENPPPSIEFIADHPFLFMLKEEISETILFVGAALNPLL